MVFLTVWIISACPYRTRCQHTLRISCNVKWLFKAISLIVFEEFKWGKILYISVLESGGRESWSFHFENMRIDMDGSNSFIVYLDSSLF